LSLLDVNVEMCQRLKAFCCRQDDFYFQIAQSIVFVFGAHDHCAFTPFAPKQKRAKGNCAFLNHEKGRKSQTHLDTVWRRMALARAPLENGQICVEDLRAH
jgi:hypothetical protein